MQKTISIFVDEAGDFGKYDKKCPYYMISMVFHDQDGDLKEELKKLNSRLGYLNLSDHVLHTGPLIRKESVYKEMTIQERLKILTCFFSLFNNIDVKYHTFIVEKKEKDNSFKLIGVLSRLINEFITNNQLLFEGNKIVIYYDNGQKQVGNIIASVFNSYDCEFRYIKPENYRLFQLADLVTTMELINYKNENMCNSGSEIWLFGSMRLFKKNFYKKIKRKKI